MSPRATILPVVVGLTLLIGTPTALVLTGTVGTTTVGQVPPTASTPATPPSAAPAPVEHDRPAIGAASSTSGPVARPARPSQLGLPGTDAPLVPVGLEPEGGMALPEDVTEVGWYELGVRPGEAGTAVLAGHVDSREQGPGALFDARRLQLDDEVTVTLADGEVQRWEVSGRTSYAKTELPVDELFVRGGPVRLALITCGGDFDPATRSYEENVVVLLGPAD